MDTMKKGEKAVDKSPNQIRGQKLINRNNEVCERSEKKVITKIINFVAITIPVEDAGVSRIKDPKKENRIFDHVPCSEKDILIEDGKVEELDAFNVPGEASITPTEEKTNKHDSVVHHIEEEIHNEKRDYADDKANELKPQSNNQKLEHLDDMTQLITKKKRKSVHIEPMKFSSHEENCITSLLFIGNQYVGNR